MRRNEVSVWVGLTIGDSLTRLEVLPHEWMVFESLELSKRRQVGVGVVKSDLSNTAAD